MYFSLSLVASVLAGLQLVTATPAASSVKLATRADNGACAKASAAAAAYMKANPNLKMPIIAAELAYDCLKSVPLKKDPAVQLVRSLKTYAQIQSSIDYLRNPPSGYLWDPVDIPRLLDAIETKLISKDTYESEYDFQLDLQSTFIRGKDGHLAFMGDLTNTFTWMRPYGFTVVSVSLDGKELPQIYQAQEVLTIDSTTGAMQVKPGFKGTPIKTINGRPADEFMLGEAGQGLGQDPDNLWNTRFLRIQDVYQHDGAGEFNQPTFYPGPVTTIEFQNGTKVTLNNIAMPATKDALAGISTGEDMYTKFCTPKTLADDDDDDTLTKRNVNMIKRNVVPLTSRQSGSTVSLYPKPIIIDNTGVIAGYYLDNSNVAVLTVHSFLPGKGTKAQMEAFQLTAQKFFADAVQRGKTKLVIDLQGNGGGSLDLCIDLVAQLFPTIPPNSKDNMRASRGMYSIMLAASNIAEAADSLDAESDAIIDDRTVPFSYQEVMTPDVKNFNRLSDYYGPQHVGNGLFTNFFQGNYTNDSPSQYGLPGIVITGTNSRKNFKQPFKAEDIIMVTDGVCASACTIFSEHMKQQGVQVIALGGRPQTGPMQAVGGTKGSQVFQAANLKVMIGMYSNATYNTELAKAKGTMWENFNTVPILRSNTAVGVNGRNQFRIGDTTQTPLQFVYEAADCRIFQTPEMVASPIPIWQRVASLAFEYRKNGVIDSPYCVKDSTKHATSLSGGLKKGDIGPQTVPANARSKVKGFLVNGKDIVTSLASGKIDDKSPVDPSVATSDDNLEGANSPDVIAAVDTIVSVCKGYKGTEWFVQLLCAALTKQA